MPRAHHLHLVSDSTGETLRSISNAVGALFEDIAIQEHIHRLVRSEQELDEILTALAQNPGPVFYSLVRPELHKKLESFCDKHSLPSLSVLDPFISLLGDYWGASIKRRPGGQHVMDKAYFKRIAALNYIIQHDDGQKHDDLNDADVILVGVSRTSKTPTCMYLANRGVKSANIPFVLNSPVLDILPTLTKPRIVGLMINPDRLVQLRKNRQLGKGQDTGGAYVNIEEVRTETNAAAKFFRKHKWAVIDITRRSIEETAAEILRLLQERAGKK